jgi:ornithine cyclodeaminase
VEQLAADGIDASVAGPEAVREADIVCTCTTASEPLFPAAWVAPGTHVNAVGTHRTDARELDGALLADSLIAVETRASALAEAGDIVLAIAEGAITEDAIDGELADLVTGRVARAGAAQTTVFKSVGLAVEDLVVARAAVGPAPRADAAL